MNFVLFMQETFIVTFYLKRTEDEEDVVPGYLGGNLTIQLNNIKCIGP